jgi:hypothetical protein
MKSQTHRRIYFASVASIAKTLLHDVRIFATFLRIDAFASFAANRESQNLEFFQQTVDLPCFCAMKTIAKKEGRL